jgi:hypothetical protein
MPEITVGSVLRPRYVYREIVVSSRCTQVDFGSWNSASRLALHRHRFDIEMHSNALRAWRNFAPYMYSGGSLATCV